MTKYICFSVFIIASLASFAENLDFNEKQIAIEASNYGLCHELKLRAPKGDEVLIKINCEAIIKSYDLKMERKNLLKRLNEINAELKKIELNKGQLQ
ncbi:MAG: hypothetical protein L6Q37_08120 [Bdellovibrionaceae bacterium]|nr:hypothetical protein [Pseudobdellovibrionaceae bacterium]NUM57333.1 hypothetical protein [Pseudobdellovibrionaceae bacterium]